MNRVASALKDNDAHYHEFRDILLEMRFMPAGRIQAAMGSTRLVTPYNCYVSGTIEDSFVHGSGSIMDRAKEAATTMRMGGGIGYDFSTLRPKGALIKKLQSRSNGPISFMDIFDAVGRATASAGHRRGAQMGVLRVDHPDVEEFIHAKQNTNRLTGFNISLGVTDAFMEAVLTGKPFDLTFGGEVYKTVDAQALWETIMRSTWDWAEPGVLFIDTINRMNNLYYCERIAATNPCGEQPLPPFGACLLGSFNLVKYVKFDASVGIYYFDWDQFNADIPIVVRAMDNVVDRAIYPLYEQEKEAKSKRRMGLGVTGLANAIEAMGYPYGSPGFIQQQKAILETLMNASYKASAKLAAEKGSFPLFDKEKYLAGNFVKGLDSEAHYLIAKHGIRNSHLTSIAPTGTISMCADNVSSGIEPVFAYKVQRTVIEFEGPRIEEIEDYGVRVFGVFGKTINDVTVDEHVSVIKACAPLVDSAVSKTCNVTGKTPWEAFKRIYVDAWEGGCKGATTFNVDGRRGAVIVAKEDDSRPEATDVTQAVETPEGMTCRIDPATGRKECE